MKEKYYSRFNLNQRIQHIVLVLSFSALAVTGLPLLFHDWNISQSLAALLGGLDVTRIIHRFAAIAFTGVFVFHILYLIVKAAAYKIKIRKFDDLVKVYPILPTFADIKDFFRLVAHYLGFIKHPPRFGRFDMFQKFEYWAGVWGFVVMIVTGLVNWFPVIASNLFPAWSIPFAKSLHGWEAVLAVLSIVLIHIYATVWSPRVLPLDTSIWTGKISEDRLAEEHPLEYEDIITSTSKKNEHTS